VTIPKTDTGNSIPGIGHRKSLNGAWNDPAGVHAEMDMGPAVSPSEMSDFSKGAPFLDGS